MKNKRMQKSLNQSNKTMTWIKIIDLTHKLRKYKLFSNTSIKKMNILNPYKKNINDSI